MCFIAGLPPMTPAIVGIAGPALLDTEAALLRAHQPAGVILFARNIHDPPQLAPLVDGAAATCCRATPC